MLGVCALATKHVFDARTVEHWTYLASVERYDKPGNPRKAELERIHAPQDWTALSKAMSRHYMELGREPPLSDDDLKSIAAPVLVISSNRDHVVPWEESLLHPVARIIATWMEKVRTA